MTGASVVPGGAVNGAPLLEMHGIVKTFPGVRALAGVDLDVRPGEVHCLLGQNGAGKSTLIKVLAGAHQPDEGTITWRGEQVTLGDPQSAMRLGIATIYQELDLVEGLSVAENVYLGHEPTSAVGRISGWPRRVSSCEAARFAAAGRVIPNREVSRPRKMLSATVRPGTRSSAW